MKRLALTLILLATFACSSSDRDDHSPIVPGRRSLAIEVSPNPIKATRVSGDTYDFPFTIALRETGGSAIDIQSVTLDVKAIGLTLYTESLDSAEITRRGFPTRVEANGEIRYTLNPRKEVPDDSLFSTVYAELSVRGVDRGGAVATASERVTVRR